MNLKESFFEDLRALQTRTTAKAVEMVLKERALLRRESVAQVRIKAKTTEAASLGRAARAHLQQARLKTQAAEAQEQAMNKKQISQEEKEERLVAFEKRMQERWAGYDKEVQACNKKAAPEETPQPAPKPAAAPKAAAKVAVFFRSDPLRKDLLCEWFV